MSRVAIRVEGLGKRYRIGRRERYHALRDVLARAFSGSVDAGAPDLAGAPGDSLWALKGVSFELGEGDILGVVGANGAGKSTLLKILSRITGPTEGYAEVRGRVGSLLEVGSGFHPELSGRENVYLNGAILGMRKVEIASKFDEIVAFAEVERFVDMPVKHYSTGMYLRLAFAVAAHLQPDILLVDEVLAVGDVSFQRKCLGKMGDVASGGRTVILVSHNVLAIEYLCRSALLLEQGVVACRGTPRTVLEEYLGRSTAVARRVDLDSVRTRSGSGQIRLASVEIGTLEGPENSVIRSGDGFVIRLGFRCRERVVRPVFSVAIYSLSGVPIFAVHTSDASIDIRDLAHDGCIELEIARANLMPGRYWLHVAVGDEMDPHRYDHVLNAVALELEPADVYGSGKLGAAGWTVVFLDCRWRLTRESRVGSR